MGQEAGLTGSAGGVEGKMELTALCAKEGYGNSRSPLPRVYGAHDIDSYGSILVWWRKSATLAAVILWRSAISRHFGQTQSRHLQ